MSVLTPLLPGLIGGSLIGLAAGTLLLMNGDIMGASGITTPLITDPTTTFKSQSWKYVFTASFLVAANLYQSVVDPNVLVDNPEQKTLTTTGYMLAGFLVGIGTKLGNGCTSGHGICGMARLSKRSFAAVGTFMTVAATTTTLMSQEFMKQIASLFYTATPVPPTADRTAAMVLTAVPLGVALYCALTKKCKKTVGAMISGSLFAVGLGVGQMVLPSKVLGFLDLSGFSKGTYDPSLMAVMASGCVVSLLSYVAKAQFRHEQPLCALEYKVPTNTIIDTPLLLGASIFGLGWGLGGFCPGPALFWAATGMTPVLFQWMPCFFMGSYLASEVKSYLETSSTGTKPKVN